MRKKFSDYMIPIKHKISPDKKDANKDIPEVENTTPLKPVVKPNTKGIDLDCKHCSLKFRSCHSLYHHEVHKLLYKILEVLFISPASDHINFWLVFTLYTTITCKSLLMIILSLLNISRTIFQWFTKFLWLWGRKSSDILQGEWYRNK